MRHIPKEDKYLVIYNLFSHKTFICWMLLIQPGLYFFIVRKYTQVIEAYLGTEPR